MHYYYYLSVPQWPSVEILDLPTLTLEKWFNVMRGRCNSVVFLLFQIVLRVRQRVYIPAAKT